MTDTLAAAPLQYVSFTSETEEAELNATLQALATQVSLPAQDLREAIDKLEATLRENADCPSPNILVLFQCYCYEHLLQVEASLDWTDEGAATSVEVNGYKYVYANDEDTSFVAKVLISKL